MVVAATGFFDGVHLGHAKVIEELCSAARAEGKESAIVTFWPHPRIILGQDAEKLRLLTSLEEKKELFRAMGVDHVYVLDFTKEMSRLSAEQFISEYLIKKLGVSTLVIGYDHRIGHGAAGKGAALKKVAESLGLNAVRVKAVEDEYDTISSTHIRSFIESGVMERANEMLGYNYFLTGSVSEVDKASGLVKMELDEPLKLLPERGDYDTEVTVSGIKHQAVGHVFRGKVSFTADSFSEIEKGDVIRAEFISKL
ncbi:MAG: FAD synthetase family protein [Bacteroidales bacterium]|nr:FAD synthetase family protein [Bacteroidales bacterium]